MKNRIGIFTGSRGEWGYLRPVMEQMKINKVDFKTIIANMHLLPEKGFTYREIEKDGFKIDEKIYMNISGPDEISWSKSLGLLLMQLPDIINKLDIDILLLAGDRAETFIAANAAYYSDIPIAHIQAGELSGHKDGMVRHAIGKLAHIHFASNEDASNRLKRFGEQEFRIHNVGAPQLDDIVNQKLFSLNQLKKNLNSKIEKEFALCIVHPTSENPDECKDYVDLINKVCIAKKIQQIWIYPNNDSGSLKIINSIESSISERDLGFRSLNRKKYLSLLKHCKFIIGNSSSGILEAPSFKIPTINLGLRQRARIAAESVLDVEKPGFEKLKKALKEIESDSFQNKLKIVKNPYGDGKSSKRIIDILKKTKLNMNLRNKFVSEEDNDS